MKLKYFISFFALVALLSACSDDDAVTMLDEIQVSSSYVAVDVDGGSNAITLNAVSSWAFDAEEIPEWLTVSPMTGEAGECKVTFSAPATEDGRSAVLHVTCAGKSQTINVIQGLPVVTEATCAEVIAGPESKTYRVTGTVTKIENTIYGNWWLMDETGSIYIYGTLDKNGSAGKNNSIDVWGIEEGDIITVEGPKTVYNGKIELVDVTVIKLQKWMIQLDGFDPDKSIIPMNGGDVTVNMLNKSNNGITVEIPDEAKSWLSILSVTGGKEPTVTFRATANNGDEERSADVSIKTTDDNGQEYTALATIKQAGPECSLAEFLEAPVGDKRYRISGVITKVVNSESGNIYIRDWSDKEVYAYQVGAKGEFKEAGLKVGDIVTLVGKRGEYNGNPQMSGGVVLDSYKHVTQVTIEQFLAQEDNPDVYYMVTGTVDAIDNPVWGNLYLVDGSGRLYVYGTYPGWGATGDNRKNWLATAGIEEGDELTVIGIRSTYQGNPQLKNGIYFSHEKND